MVDKHPCDASKSSESTPNFCWFFFSALQLVSYTSWAPCHLCPCSTKLLKSSSLAAPPTCHRDPLLVSSQHLTYGQPLAACHCSPGQPGASFLLKRLHIPLPMHSCFFLSPSDFTVSSAHSLSSRQHIVLATNKLLKLNNPRTRVAD